MLIAAVFFPLLGAFIAGFFGRIIGDRASQVVTCLGIGLAALAALPGDAHRRVLDAREQRITRFRRLGDLVHGGHVPPESQDAARVAGRAAGGPLAGGARAAPDRR